MQLWVGLGNPGAKYQMNRHNIGFMAVDAIAEVHGFGSVQRKVQGWTQDGRIDGEKERVTDLDNRIQETHSRIKEIEDMTTGQRQRLRKLENEISSTVDTALIVAYQHEIRTLRRDIGEAEEEGLALVEETDRLGA